MACELLRCAVAVDVSKRKNGSALSSREVFIAVASCRDGRGAKTPSSSQVLRISDIVQSSWFFATLGRKSYQFMFLAILGFEWGMRPTEWVF